MKPTRSKLITVAVLLLVVCAAGQSGDTAAKPTTPKNAGPKIGAAFAKAAVKALLTIDGTRDKPLVDAAIIDASAEQSTQAELRVVWHIQLFQQIYALNDLVGDHYEDQRCIVAWLPKLRGLSAEVPRQCPRLTADEMGKMTRP